MNLIQLQKYALKIKSKYRALEIKRTGKIWTNEQLAQGFIQDVNELMNFVKTKEKNNKNKTIDIKIAHELSDCLWSTLVLAHIYNINLEKSFLGTMSALEMKIDSQIKLR